MITLLLSGLGVGGLAVPLLLRVLGVGIPTRLIVYIAIAGAVLLAFGRFIGWIDGLHAQIAAAHAETRAAHVQTAHAVLYGMNRQTQVFADVSSIAALRGSLNDQSARVRRLEADGRQAAQEAQERLRRVEAAHIADEARIAALSRPVAGATACERAENRRAAVLEALR